MVQLQPSFCLVVPKRRPTSSIWIVSTTWQYNNITTMMMTIRRAARTTLSLSNSFASSALWNRWYYISKNTTIQQRSHHFGASNVSKPNNGIIVRRRHAPSWYPLMIVPHQPQQRMTSSMRSSSSSLSDNHSATTLSSTSTSTTTTTSHQHSNNSDKNHNHNTKTNITDHQQQQNQQQQYQKYLQILHNIQYMYDTHHYIQYQTIVQQQQKQSDGMLQLQKEHLSTSNTTTTNNDQPQQQLHIQHVISNMDTYSTFIYDIVQQYQYIMKQSSNILSSTMILEQQQSQSQYKHHDDHTTTTNTNTNIDPMMMNMISTNHTIQEQIQSHILQYNTMIQTMVHNIMYQQLYQQSFIQQVLQKQTQSSTQNSSSITASRNSNIIETNVPFIYMIQVLVQCVGMIPPQYSLQILQDWIQYYNGHIELSPHISYYQKIIYIYAHSYYNNLNHHHTRIQQQPTFRIEDIIPIKNMISSTNTNTYQYHQNPSHIPSMMIPYPETMDVVHEIIDFIEHSYPTMNNHHPMNIPSSTHQQQQKHHHNHHTTMNIEQFQNIPNLYTYQYMIQCMTRAMKYQYDTKIIPYIKMKNQLQHDNLKRRQQQQQHQQNHTGQNDSDNNNMKDHDDNDSTISPTTTISITEYEQSMKLVYDYFNTIQGYMDVYIQHIPTSLSSSTSTSGNHYPTKIHDQQCMSIIQTITNIISCYKIMDDISIHQQSISKIEYTMNDPITTHQRQYEYMNLWFRLIQPGNTDLFIQYQEEYPILVFYQNDPLHNELPINNTNPTNISTTSSSSSSSSSSNLIQDINPKQQQYISYVSKSGFAILEQTTMSILELLSHEMDQMIIDHTDPSVLNYQNTDTTSYSIGGMNTISLSSSSSASISSITECLQIVERMTQYVLQLDDMMRTYKMDSTTSYLPSGRHYHRVIQTWMNFMKYNRSILHQYQYDTIGHQQVSLLLLRMYEQHTRNHSHPQTVLEHSHATESWNNLLQAYLDAKQPDKVIELWNLNHQKKFGRIRKNQDSFTMILLAYSAKRQTHDRHTPKQLAEQAHSILSKLVSYDPSKRLFQPTSKQYASVMVAWSRSYAYYAAFYCQEVFDNMLEESNRIQKEYATAKSASSSSSSSFEDSYQVNSDTHDETTTDFLRPATIHYDALLTCWGHSKLPEATQRILDIYHDMKQSNLYISSRIYGTILFALSKIKSVPAAEHAEEILNQLEYDAIMSMHDKNHISSTDDKSLKSLYIDSMSTFFGTANEIPSDDIQIKVAHGKDVALKDQEHDDDDITEDVYIPLRSRFYRSVMFAWLHSGALDAQERCSKIFLRLLKAFKNSGWDKRLQPNSAIYAIIIDSISSDSSKPQHLKILQAEKILNEMEAHAKAGHCEQPSMLVYVAVMKAYMNTSLPNVEHKIEELVQRMRVAYENGNTQTKPDTYTASLLIEAWSKSHNPNKAKIAWDIYKEMNDAYKNGDIYMQPSSYTFRHLLRACTHTKTTEKSIKNEALKIALLTLNEIDNDTNRSLLSEYVFSELIHVIANQIDDITERTLHARVIFERCCQAGFVNKLVLDTLKNHVPGLYHKLPTNQNKELMLPKEWSRNRKIDY